MARNDVMIDVKEAGDKKGANPFSADETKVSNVVRFWSTQIGYTIAVAPGKNVVFKKHVLALESHDPAVSAVRKTRSSEVKEVLDKPYESEVDLAKFNKFLQKLVYRGEYGTVSKRGMTALLGLFGPNDKLDPTSTPDTLIMKALKTKSFKEGI